MGLRVPIGILIFSHQTDNIAAFSARSHPQPLHPSWCRWSTVNQEIRLRHSFFHSFIFFTNYIHLLILFFIFFINCVHSPIFLMFLINYVHLLVLFSFSIVNYVHLLILFSFFIVNYVHLLILFSFSSSIMSLHRKLCLTKERTFKALPNIPISWTLSIIAMAKRAARLAWYSVGSGAPLTHR